MHVHEVFGNSKCLAWSAVVGVENGLEVAAEVSRSRPLLRALPLP